MPIWGGVDNDRIRVLVAHREAAGVLTRYTSSKFHSEDENVQLVEALREIAEILIWGDQNDQAVFEYVCFLVS